MSSHGEFICPAPCCSGDTTEARIAREIVGCDAGRHCTAVPGEQLVELNARIEAALAAVEQEANAT